ncbi:MAG: transporter substrate-binding domain-containing protein, partial [Bacilli bacterium]|nr:transporter substrate-binding domain-containing protein [Bacilli bacterium]
PYGNLPNTKGNVRLNCVINPPFSLVNASGYAGYEVELAVLFCKSAGYSIDILDVNFDALLPGILTNKSDVACGGVTITEERKETMAFSEADYVGGTAVLVLNGKGDSGSGGFWQSIAESFEKTFIREERYLLFLSGILTTLAITFLSIIFGTVLGFLGYLTCRKGNKVSNAIARFSIWLIQGMPVVVLLMILYYIVFGNVAISGAAVSIIGFTLIFGAAFFNMLKVGVDAIDKGQREAAYSLGYSDRRAFFRIILPQAAVFFMPSYKREITSLIKATAIVGYVAVMDLTKVGDLIRSNTFEPFFPLIAVAVFYFVLAALLIFLVNRLEFLVNPKKRKRKRMLKGVKR